jgi:hypothetical protein
VRPRAISSYFESVIERQSLCKSEINKNYWHNIGVLGAYNIVDEHKTWFRHLVNKTNKGIM